jgi:predicted DNA repair protein MutK
MKFLSVAGTAAMFLVGGGIVAHGVPFIEHFQQALFEGLSQSWTNIAGMLWNAAIGIALGIVVNGVVISVKAFRS